MSVRATNDPCGQKRIFAASPKRHPGLCLTPDEGSGQVVV